MGEAVLHVGLKQSLVGFVDILIRDDFDIGGDVMCAAKNRASPGSRGCRRIVAKESGGSRCPKPSESRQATGGV